MLTDVIAAIFAGVAWTGNFVLFLLFRRQVAGLRLLERYVFWKFFAWSWLILLQVIIFMYLDIAVLIDRKSYKVVDNVRLIGFHMFMAYAAWLLVFDILKPRVVSPVVQPEAQIQMDAQGIIVGWNTHAETLFGWLEEEVVGQDLAEKLIPEAMREAHRAGLLHYRQTGEAPLIDSRYTQRALRKDGTSILIDVSLTAHLTSQGTVFLGTCSPATLL